MKPLIDPHVSRCIVPKMLYVMSTRKQTASWRNTLHVREAVLVCACEVSEAFEVRCPASALRKGMIQAKARHHKHFPTGHCGRFQVCHSGDCSHRPVGPAPQLPFQQIQQFQQIIMSLPSWLLRGPSTLKLPIKPASWICVVNGQHLDEFAGAKHRDALSRWHSPRRRSVEL